jgi:hypothetical protein
MKNNIEILSATLFISWAILIPAIFKMKIKYFVVSRQKESPGIREWCITCLTWEFPIIGRDENLELDTIRKKANYRLYYFYLIILLQLILVGILNKIK